MKGIRIVPLVAALLALLPALGQESTFTDPAQAGPDYAIQGEYAGRLGNQRLGAQVVALGEGTFRLDFLPGGLPGDGWDGKTRIRLEGRTVGELTAFESPATTWRAFLGDGRIAGQTDTGAKFRLTRVERRSPTEGLKPPPGAIVLFDGTGVDHWIGGRMTPDGLLEAGARTRQAFRDFTLHLEFRIPFRPSARGQARGNSGVYLLNRYEIQILDSFGQEARDDGCGAIYRHRAPDIPMCFPPLAWQTFDIDFQAPRLDAGGRKQANAVVTVRHNGVIVHDRVELNGATGRAAAAGENVESGPILLQNHGSPVRFRNVWIVPR